MANETSIQSQNILKDCYAIISRQLATNTQNVQLIHETGSIYAVLSLFVLVEGFFRQKIISHRPSTLQALKNILKPMNSDLFSRLDILDLLPDDGYQKLFHTLTKMPLSRESNDLLSDFYGEHLFRNSAKRSAQGSIYTPEFVRQYMIKKSLANLLKTNDELKSQSYAILDPACGTGRFLIDIYDHIHDKNPSPSSMSQQVTNLFGLDIDCNALVLAFSCLALRNAFDYKTVFSCSFFHCNTLEIFKWPIRNPQTFDLIIGNPPFVMGDNIPKNLREYLKEAYQEIFQAEADLSYYFLDRAIQLLSPRGFLSFVFPRYLFKAFYGARIRKRVLDQCIIPEIFDFNQLDPFKGIGSRTCLIFLQKCQDQETRKNHLIKVDTVISQRSNNLQTIFLTLNSSEYVKTYYVSQKNLDEKPWLLVDKENAEFFQMMKKKRPTLKTLGFKVGRGGITGHPVFTVTQNDVDKYLLEKDLLYKITKNSEIKRYGLTHTHQKFVLFLETIDSYDALKSFPQVISFLEPYLSELALRKEFQPKGSPLRRQGNDLLKEILEHSFSQNPVSVEMVKKKLIQIPNLDLEDVLSLSCGIKLQNNQVLIDYTSDAFHNFWQWWKWTRPQNLQLFQSQKIICPYIAPYNRFALDSQNTFNDTSDVLGITIGPSKLKEHGYSVLFLLGCLNSLPLNLFHALRAKKKDYRYEYYPLPILEIPLPCINDDFSLEEVRRVETLASELTKYWTSYFQVLNNVDQFLKSKFPLKASLDSYRRFFTINLSNSLPYKIKKPTKTFFSLLPLVSDRIILYVSIDGSDFKNKTKIEIQSSSSRARESLFVLLNWFLNKYQGLRYHKWRNFPRLDQIINNMKLFPEPPSSNTKQSFLNHYFDLLQEKIAGTLVDISFAGLTQQLFELENEMHQLILKGYNLTLKN
ncbi:MAG: class I SAM-dependent DNA methyltransferase, partial [Candidatus Hodarchaeota archaeon]